MQAFSAKIPISVSIYKLVVWHSELLSMCQLWRPGTVQASGTLDTTEQMPVNSATNVWCFKEFQQQTGISLETLTRWVDIQVHSSQSLCSLGAFLSQRKEIYCIYFSELALLQLQLFELQYVEVLTLSQMFLLKFLRKNKQTKIKELEYEIEDKMNGFVRIEYEILEFIQNYLTLRSNLSTV